MSAVPSAHRSRSRRTASIVTSAGIPSVATPRYPRPAANLSLHVESHAPILPPTGIVR